VAVSSSCFLQEPSTTMLVGESVRGEDLDRDLAAEARIVGTIDLTHAAGAEEAPNLVGTEPRTG
jgi:hypothetical protein